MTIIISKDKERSRIDFLYYMLKLAFTEQDRQDMLITHNGFFEDNTLPFDGSLILFPKAFLPNGDFWDHRVIDIWRQVQYNFP
jgi:hypothetical protein